MKRLLVSLLLLVLPSVAQAWEPFRSESRDVARGNEHLQKGQYDEALEAYETAARKLPQEPAVQLNRGLALMGKGKLDEAREAFRASTQGNASPELRAQGNYDLGLAFLAQADATAKANDLEGAQKQLREAVDAFKSSLRAQPKNRDAAWNLELARRRLVEVEKKQEEQKKQDEEKKKDEDQKKKQDEEKKQDPSQNQGDAGTPEPKSDEPDAPKEGDQQPDTQKPPEQDPKEGKDGAKQDEQAKQEGAPKEAEQTKDQPGNQAEDKPERAMPEHMQRALDSLEASEENLEKHRAQARARQRPRRVEKDW